MIRGLLIYFQFKRIDFNKISCPKISMIYLINNLRSHYKLWLGFGCEGLSGTPYIIQAFDTQNRFWVFVGHTHTHTHTHTTRERERLRDESEEMTETGDSSETIYYVKYRTFLILQPFLCFQLNNYPMFDVFIYILVVDTFI